MRATHCSSRRRIISPLSHTADSPTSYVRSGDVSSPVIRHTSTAGFITNAKTSIVRFMCTIMSSTTWYYKRESCDAQPPLMQTAEKKLPTFVRKDRRASEHAVTVKRARAPRKPIGQRKVHALRDVEANIKAGMVGSWERNDKLARLLLQLVYGTRLRR